MLCYSTVRVQANRLSYDLYLDYFELARVVRLGVGRQASPAALAATCRRF